MSDEELHNELGRMLAERKRLHGILSCLKVKAHRHADDFLTAHKALYGKDLQKPKITGSYPPMPHMIPSVPESLLSPSEAAALLGEIAETESRMAVLSERLKDFEVGR